MTHNTVQCYQDTIKHVVSTWYKKAIETVEKSALSKIEALVLPSFSKIEIHHLGTYFDHFDIVYLPVGGVEEVVGIPILRR